MTAKLITMFSIGVSTAVLEKLLETNGKSTMANYVNQGGTAGVIVIALGVVKEVIDSLRSI